ALDEKLVACGLWYEDPSYREMQKMLDLPNPPDAVFCANDMMAMAAIRAIRDKGLRVPQDVAVAGFDDLEAGRYFATPLTTIRPPLYDVGTQALALLMEVLQNPARPPEQIKLKSELIVRASTVA
ncbi:MAG: substrate-binding domain-containing protein, partial [Kiritimatiellae bacterium]|nr:substrate-binding domain-containing protein [Kiritimatiellia bacterium]